MSVPRAVAAALVAVVASLSLFAGSAGAARDFKVGFADDVFADRLFFSADPDVRDLWFDRTEKTNADLVRLNLYWSRIASDKEPANAADPADPSYDWEEMDRAVIDADERGLDVLFTVFSAPAYAEGGHRPSIEKARAGTWKPKGGKFEEFAKALAKRYSGSYRDPQLGILPQVRYFEGWNEPNLHLYINPQRKGKKDTSPKIYRKLLNGFYDGIKSVDRKNKVLSAGTSPFGDPTGARRIPPVEFWRGVFCLKNRHKLKFQRKGCPKKGNARAHLDIFAHNSINEPGTAPKVKAELADNATAPDMHKLVDVIRAAEKHHTVKGGGKRHAVWSTELWFESRPPEKKGAPLQKHARYLSEVLYILYRQHVDAGIFLQIRDSPYNPDTPAVIGLQSGVYFNDGKPKPALESVQFPFYAERKGRKKVLVWGKAPRSGKLEIADGKRTEARFNVKSGKVFKKKIQLRGKAKVTAAVGSEKSIVWKLGKK